MVAVGRQNPGGHITGPARDDTLQLGRSEGRVCYEHDKHYGCHLDCLLRSELELAIKEEAQPQYMRASPNKETMKSLWLAFRCLGPKTHTR